MLTWVTALLTLVRTLLTWVITFLTWVTSLVTQVIALVTRYFSGIYWVLAFFTPLEATLDMDSRIFLSFWESVWSLPKVPTMASS